MTNRTTGKGFYRWIKKQDGVQWYKNRPLMCYLNYEGVRCAGMLTKVWGEGGQLIRVYLKIVPVIASQDIGKGAGQPVYMTFEENANKSKKGK